MNSHFTRAVHSLRRRTLHIGIHPGPPRASYPRYEQLARLSGNPSSPPRQTPELIKVCPTCIGHMTTDNCASTPGQCHFTTILHMTTDNLTLMSGQRHFMLTHQLTFPGSSRTSTDTAPGMTAKTSLLKQGRLRHGLSYRIRLRVKDEKYHGAPFQTLQRAFCV